MNHKYRSRVVWDGNKSGKGTSDYATYDRQYRIITEGKPDINGSSDALFKGDGSKLNPEDLFVAAISSCHLLSYLALCGRNGISVASYEDDAVGVMSLDAARNGKFEEVVLRPRVTIQDGDVDLALRLHETAHHQCYIANSCSCTIRNEPTVARAPNPPIPS